MSDQTAKTERVAGPAAAPRALPGLYVHAPFCRSKCHYCGFYSSTEPHEIDRWLASLRREARSYRRDWSTFDSCYIGGGTPSLLSEATIAALLELVHENFHLRNAELTIEVNPGDVTKPRARRWIDLGFNRVSVGIQSFRDAELRWLGRRHDAQQAVGAVQTLRQAGFDNLGIDIVYGLPAQSQRAQLESLRKALELQPEHLSCYELTVEADTPLNQQVTADQVVMPDADTMAKAFMAVSELLSGHGYHHYEVSNFARSQALIARHNTKYWQHVPYLGLGPAAHSFDGRNRWHNYRSMREYCRALESDGPDDSAVAFRERLSAEQLRWERVALGLRTAAGVRAADLRSPPNPRQRLAQLQQAGLLERTDDRIVPTADGMMKADALARCLLLDS